MLGPSSYWDTEDPVAVDKCSVMDNKEVGEAKHPLEINGRLFVFSYYVELVRNIILKISLRKGKATQPNRYLFVLRVRASII